MSPDLLEVPLLDDEHMSWRFEQAQFIKKAITRAIHGPLSHDELIDNHIVHSYETTPHGKQAAATAAALDKAGIPCHHDEKGWSEALKGEKGAKVRAFFSMRYKRKTKPQN